jgi:hypothetical protein
MASVPARSDLFLCIAIFALPFGLLTEVEFIGRIFLTEMLFLLLMPFLLLTSRAPLSQLRRKTLWLVASWLVALMVADFYRNSDAYDFLRGWAKLIFLSIDFYVLCRLLTTQQRMLAWFVGWNIAYCIFAWQEFPEFATTWKFGVGVGSLNTVVGIATMVWPRRSRYFMLLLSVICIGYAIASLLLNARSSFLAMTVSAFFLGICSLSRARQLLIDLWDRHGLIVIIGAIAMAYVAGSAYIVGAGAGLFGDEARQKLEAQRLESFDPVLGILAGGRPESFSSWAAIADSPIIGHGSWARNAEYFNIYINALRTYGSAETIREAEGKIYVGEPMIPTHSHIFGAWVEAGLIGAVFWVFVLRLIFRSMRRALDLRAPTDVLILLTGAMMIWDVFFSPFGANERLSWAAALVLLIFGNQESPPVADVASCTTSRQISSS